MWNSFWNDETGFLVSAEMVLVATIVVLALVVGLSEIAVALTTELDDIGNAIGALNQSYSFSGFTAIDTKVKSFYAGSRFNDATDDCDLSTSCSLVCGFPVDRTESLGGHR